MVRAATYEGRASAMVITFCMTHTAERVEIWEAEREAWQKRGDRLIDQARVGQTQLRMDSLEAQNAASGGVDPVGVM